VKTKTIGPYALIDRIGSHTRHHVYSAEHLETGERVALKFVKMPSKVPRESAVKKIEFEANILKRIAHPNLVKIVDAGVHEDKAFFAMEPTTGESLSKMMGRRGKLAWDLSLEYAEQIARALDYIHELDLVHLKMTPEKILLTEEGQVKIADLRVNRAKKRRWDTGRRREVDIAAYMSPEQLNGEGGTAKSDVYALGVILFEMLTGSLPHTPDNLPRLAKQKQTIPAPPVSQFTLDCPIFVEKLVKQMLEIDPQDRPHSTKALLMAFEEIKMIDAQKRSVAEQMTSGFNALTAGSDNTEAKKILGKKEKRQSEQSFFQRTEVLATGLVLSVTLLGFLIWFAIAPKSEADLYAGAKELMEQGDSRSLKIAHAQFIEPMMKHYPHGEHAEQVRAWYDEVKMHYAMTSMKRRFRFGFEPKTPVEAGYVKAWQIEQFGDLPQAIELYQVVVDQGNLEDESERFYVLLAKRHIEELGQAQNESQSIDELLTEKLEQADQFEAEDRTVDAHRIWKQIVDTYRDNEEAKAHFEKAREKLGAE